MKIFKVAEAASLLAIFEMNKHFDLNIIGKDFKGETYEEYLGI